MATEYVAAVTRPADVGLRREMGLVGATWASETSIIGSGWLFTALFAAQGAGPAAIIGWLIAGAIVMILALVYAELGAMYPVAGGTGRFPHFAFGSVAGISFGFFAWLQAVATAPIECYAVFTYLSYYWHGVYNTTTGKITGLGFVLTIVLMAVFTAVNFLAMRMFNKVQSAITWWKVAIPVVTIVVLLTKFHGGNFSAGGGFMNLGIKAVFAQIALSGIVFSYTGFEQADQLAAEVKNPGRNLPRAIIYSILLGTVIYVMLQVAFIGAMAPSQLIHHGFAGITDKNVLAGPFAGLAGLIGFAWLATILRIDAFFSPSGTGLVYVTSTSRVSYGLARNRYYPQAFAKIDDNGIPWVSVILAFLFGLVFLLPFPSWHSLVGLITGASVLMYAGAPLSLGAFRQQVPDAPRPYRLPGAAVIAPVAFVAANLIIYWSGFTVIWKLGVCIVIGYALIGVAMARDKQRPPLDWKSAQWLPVYLIGMGILSWQGQYSGESSTAPPLNTGRIPFWWDLVAVAAFSLVIYYWAQTVKLPKEEMAGLIARQAAPQPTTTTGS